MVSYLLATQASCSWPQCFTAVCSPGEIIGWGNKGGKGGGGGRGKHERDGKWNEEFCSHGHVVYCWCLFTERR